MRRAQVNQRKREREQRKEDRYVYGKLQRWADAEVARRGTYNIETGLRLARQWREEYRRKHPPKAPPPTLFEILFCNPAVERMLGITEGPRE